MSTETKTDIRPYEAITLALQGIQWMVNGIEHVREQMHMTPSVEGHEIPAEIAADHDRFLREVGADLAEILERVGDYCNGGDMVSDADERLMGAIFDIIHGASE